MTTDKSQAKILAQAIYEIRLLLSEYLGSENTGDLYVRKAAHLAYALHNEAEAILNDKNFDEKEALFRIRAVDRIFDEKYSPQFERLIENNKTR